VGQGSGFYEALLQWQEALLLNLSEQSLQIHVTRERSLDHEIETRQSQ
jgi:hypothetical protein